MSVPEFTLTILGCGSALPVPGRNPPAQVVRYGDVHVLIDCGEGTQMRLRELGIRPFHLNLILISHLHGDHVLGLPGLLSSMGHLGREHPLTICGPPGLAALWEMVRESCQMRIPYEIEIRELRPAGPQAVWQSDELECLTFPLDHRIACNGYLLRERRPRIKWSKPALAEAGYGPADMHALTQELGMSDPRRHPLCGSLFEVVSPISYAYCSDTRPDPRLSAWLKQVTVMYHETTFLDDLQTLARDTGHTTAAQAARIAREAEAGWLITGHYSSRYRNAQVMADEAAIDFERVLTGEDGAQYNLRVLAGKAAGSG